MKVNITIDCTPEEARSFFGLPNMEKFHDTVMEEMRQRMSKGMSAEDLENLYRLWMPGAGKSWADFQTMFWPGLTTSDDKK